MTAGSRKNPTFQAHSATVLEAIEAGAAIKDAAREVGITDRTIHRWIEYSKANPASQYGDFAARIEAVREARKFPRPGDEGEGGPLTRDELDRLVAKAARRGSVAAMRLAADLLAEADHDEDDEDDPLPAMRARLAVRRGGTA